MIRNSRQIMSSSSSQHRGDRAKVAGGRLDLARKEGTKGGAFFFWLKGCSCWEILCCTDFGEFNYDDRILDYGIVLECAG